MDDKCSGASSRKHFEHLDNCLTDNNKKVICIHVRHLKMFANYFYFDIGISCLIAWIRKKEMNKN